MLFAPALPLCAAADTSTGVANAPMADVTIYTTVSCPYCVQAKRLLAHKGVPYTEIDVTMDPELRHTMI